MWRNSLRIVHDVVHPSIPRSIRWIRAKGGKLVHLKLALVSFPTSILCQAALRGELHLNFRILLPQLLEATKEHEVKWFPYGCVIGHVDDMKSWHA